jgi:coniferyl-aldehyde dehydrogenase
MALTENRTATTGDDAAAIAELYEIVDRQRAAFLADPFPTLEERLELLGALAGMLISNRTQIQEAMSADFGVHPTLASDLIEVLGVAGRAGYVAENLSAWMAAEDRTSDPAVFGSGRAYVQPQPKGVIGNIVPWNFPFDLSVGPLVEMLAAGNRVVIKPSDFTPACAELLRDMIRATFDRDRVDVVVGELALAQAFSHVRWDHLLYTGSPAIGREIAKAAAEQLVPVTLELGGKCPAVLTPGSVTAANVDNIIGTKTIKNGQMCISVDYCLVPRAELGSFVKLAVDFVQRVASDYSRSADCTGIISPRHLDRLCEMLQEARDRQCEIVELERDGRIDRATRRMPMSLVVDPAPDLRIMQEEIFGPILPVIPYDSVDAAIEIINAGDRPLGLYVFGDDRAVTDRVLDNVTSGGAAVNACAAQGALPSLAFGGVGASGMGRHHGLEGFREFSNPRGVVVRGTGDHFDAFSAPYAKAAALVAAALGGG